MYLTISLLYKTQNVEFFSLIAYISNISIGSYMVFFFFNVSSIINAISLVSI